MLDNNTQYIMDIMLLTEPCIKKNLNIIIPTIEPKIPPDKMSNPILISN